MAPSKTPTATEKGKGTEKELKKDLAVGKGKDGKKQEPKEGMARTFMQAPP